MQVDQGNRGYYPFGMGSAKNPFAQEDRKEAFNAYGTPSLCSNYLHRTWRKGDTVVACQQVGQCSTRSSTGALMLLPF